MALEIRRRWHLYVLCRLGRHDRMEDQGGVYCGWCFADESCGATSPDIPDAVCDRLRGHDGWHSYRWPGGATEWNDP